MIGGLLILALTTFIAFWCIDLLRKEFPFVNVRLLRWLYLYHVLLSITYFIYVSFNPSDSKAYYFKVVGNFRGSTWYSFYGTSTTFVEFLGYPFIKYLGFSYEAMMALFSFFGFIGYLFFYIFFKEQIKFRHTMFGMNLVTLIFFLPNLHFWSSSFGKGAIVWLGVALYFFGIANIRRRIPAILAGALIVYHVRPHIMLIILVCSALGFIFSTKGVSLTVRVLFLLSATIAFFFIYKDVLSLVGIDEDEFITQGLDLTHRASELGKATSGVDITSYSLPLQLFTFLYRPLFFDGPGALGFIVSFENVFYLLLTLRLLNLQAIGFIFRGSFLVKSAFLSFIAGSIALAQVAGNLGLAIRQKSQVMMLFLFVILVFLEDKKLKEYKRFMAKRIRILQRNKSVT